jgi:integrase
MKRRGSGEGSLRHRPDGRWEARLRLPGNQRKHFYGETRADALKQLQAFQRQLEQGTAVQDGKLTVGRYLQDWLEGCKPPALEYSTWVTYEQFVRLHITPIIGSTRLVLLTPQQLQKLYAAKLAEGKSSTTVRHIHACLHKALEEAFRFGLVQRNVAALVKPPPFRRIPMRVFTPEQARIFLEAARGDRLEGFYILALSTGMRLGEMLSLKWRDVNLDQRLIQVQTALKRAELGKRTIGKTKTAGSKRKIMLTPTTVAALKAHRVRQLEERLQAGDAWHDNDLVFCNPIGNALDPTGVYKYRFKALLRRAGLPMLRLHDLRHSAATLLLLSGIHPKVVSELLGHSSITITLNLYSHVLPDMQAGATDAMERLLNGDLGTNGRQSGGQNEERLDG